MGSVAIAVAQTDCARLAFGAVTETKLSLQTTVSAGAPVGNERTIAPNANAATVF